jgi:hypothetical protein
MALRWWTKLEQAREDPAWLPQFLYMYLYTNAEYDASFSETARVHSLIHRFKINIALRKLRC